MNPAQGTAPVDLRSVITVLSEADTKTGDAIEALVKTNDTLPAESVALIETEMRALKDRIGLLEALLHARQLPHDLLEQPISDLPRPGDPGAV
ncbi:MAG: hypothetical protein V3S26_08710 [Acidimicrobiia bacterium]